MCLLAKFGSLAHSLLPRTLEPQDRKVKPDMSRFLNHLTNPEIVRTIAPVRLLDLLSPHQEYLAGRGLKLPTTTKASTIDHDKLINILDTPSMDTPQDMLNALGMINDMATEQGMDALLSAARHAGVKLDLTDEESPADGRPKRSCCQRSPAAKRAERSSRWPASPVASAA